MTKKSGRISQITPDGRAGIVSEADGTSHPFTATAEKTIGDAVVFEIQSRDVGNGVTTKFAELD